MIGYNYCYSTCLGRVDPFRGTYKLGWSAQHIPDGQIGLLKDHVTSEFAFSNALDVIKILISSRSLPERSDLRQANFTKELIGENVARDSRHSCHGETRNEDVQRKQGQARRVKVLVIRCGLTLGPRLCSLFFRF